MRRPLLIFNVKLVLRKANEPDVLIHDLVLLTECDDEINGPLFTSLAVLKHTKSGIGKTVTFRTDLGGGESDELIAYSKFSCPLVHAFKHLICPLPTIH